MIAVKQASVSCFVERNRSYHGEIYNQRFSVIVEIGSFGLVLPVQESSLSLWYRDTKANRERRGGRKVGGDVPR